MATFPTLHAHGLHNPLPRSQFLGQDHPLKQQVLHNHKAPTYEVLRPQAKFNILEMMGGRGLCNGEKGLEQELKRQVVVVDDDGVEEEAKSSGKKDHHEDEGGVEVPEDGFEKELMGLTGGFPGGEKGLIKFIDKIPSSKTTS